MVLSINTEEADQLPRALTKLTGETLTEAVTKALRERLERKRARRLGGDDMPARLNDLVKRLRAAYDARPVTRAEWDAATGDER